MNENKSTLIKVGKNRIGIIGLGHTIEEVEKGFSACSDDEIAEELLARLSKRNYIHTSVREKYKAAFIREYKKALNLPYEEEASDETVIRVLGQGCAQCDRLETDLYEILIEKEIAADFAHVTDPIEIAEYGPMAMPAVIVNGKTLLSGRMYPKLKLKEMLLTSLNIAE